MAKTILTLLLLAGGICAGAAQIRGRLSVIE
jgi:hypothetical protein